MPIHQDKLIRLLQAARAYRNHWSGLVGQLDRDRHNITYGKLTVSLREYNRDLYIASRQKLLEADIEHYVIIQLLSEYYTDAKIRNNQKNKVNQRAYRERLGVQPREANRTIIEPPTPQTHFVDEVTTTAEQEEEMRKIMEQMGVGKTSQ